jgi:UDP-3-O-[3-hydroxymyristoyl] glucosamine N-acyltransferase
LSNQHFQAPGFRAEEVASILGGRLVGDGQAVLRGVATLEEAGSDDLAFLSNPRYKRAAVESNAGAIIVSEKDVDVVSGKTLVVVEDSYAAFCAILPRFRPPAALPVGIAPSAWIGLDVQMGQDVSVGPSAFVGDGVVLGDRVRIFPGAVVGEGSELGDDTILHPTAVVYPGSRIGRRVVLHAGVVVGGDGFGYATVEGIHHKIPQVGHAVIEDDVEIGAGSTVDRGALGNTVVGEGSKIDNLVMVAHGVKLGRSCLLVAQSGIAGSTRLGDHVTVAGQSGAVGHIRIGSSSTIGAKSAVTRDLPDGSFVTGHPAVPHREWLEQGAALRRLPKLQERVRKLEATVDELSASLEKAMMALTARALVSAKETESRPTPEPPAAPAPASPAAPVVAPPVAPPPAASAAPAAEKAVRRKSPEPATKPAKEKETSAPSRKGLPGGGKKKGEKS